MTQYDPDNLDHVRIRRAEHRRVDHGNDMTTWFDCAACGFLDARLARLEAAYEESKKAVKS